MVIACSFAILERIYGSSAALQMPQFKGWPSFCKELMYRVETIELIIDQFMKIYECIYSNCHFTDLWGIIITEVFIQFQCKQIWSTDAPSFTYGIDARINLVLQQIGNIV